MKKAKLQTIENNISFQTVSYLIEIILALVIIGMGAYGYHKFFSGFETNSEPVWFVVVLFCFRSCYPLYDYS